MSNFTEVEYNIIRLGLDTILKSVNAQIASKVPMYEHLPAFKEQVETLHMKVSTEIDKSFMPTPYENPNQLQMPV